MYSSRFASAPFDSIAYFEPRKFIKETASPVFKLEIVVVLIPKPKLISIREFSPLVNNFASLGSIIFSWGEKSPLMLILNTILPSKDCAIEEIDEKRKRRKTIAGFITRSLIITKRF
jgi:hypothetical protein